MNIHPGAARSPRAIPPVPGFSWKLSAIGWIDVFGWDLCEWGGFSSRLLARFLRRVRIVGSNDTLNQRMAHNVFLGEVHKLNAFHVRHDRSGFNQPGGFSRWQVDLSDVTGDHGFGIEPHARQEHLHLFGGSVLGFIE